MVPENVTLLPKTKEQITGGNPSSEKIHVVKKGDTVVYGKYAGTEIKLDGIDHIILSEDEVLGIIG